jgi:radical SAM superfamily enzyme YgiQ (UPF0313 family)
VSDLLFGQSYYLRFDAKLLAASQPYPPLGTLYAASNMRRRGYQVALFDAMLAGSELEWDAALEQHQPHYAVLFEDNFNYLSKMCLARMRQAAMSMIDMARKRGCVVILCGADASDHPDLYLQRGADYIIRGEGEITLGELVDKLAGKTDLPLESIPGLVYLPQKTIEVSTKKTNGSPIFTPRRPDIKDLDSLPFPAWDLVDVPLYRQIWKNSHGYFSMNVVTTRGCPYHCNWCAKPIWGQRYNVRSPENVVEEIAWLSETYQPDHIWFVDDIIGLKPGWLERFADLIEQQNLQIPYKCLNRADLLLRPGEVEALKRSGCQIVWMGAESGSQKILDAMEKGIRIEQIYSATERLHANGIQVGFYLQFGYPGESQADIRATFRMVRDCRPDDIGMSVSYPLPGTSFYEQVKNQLGVQQNWIDSQDLAMLYRGPYPTAYYRQLHKVLHKEFRARKSSDRLIARLKVITHAGRPISPYKPPLSTVELVMQWLYNTLTLPLARFQLAQLSRHPHSSNVKPPSPTNPDAASQPSIQID